jgi:hypothetical protein
MNPDIELANVLTDIYIMAVITHKTQDPIKKSIKLSETSERLNEAQYQLRRWSRHHNINKSRFVNNGQSITDFIFGAFIMNHMKAIKHGIYMNPVQFRGNILHMIKQEAQRKYARC